MPPKIRPTYMIGTLKTTVKNIARKGQVAPIPKDLMDEAMDATQKFFS